MSETAIRCRSVNHPYWYGMLCRDTFDAAAERISRMLDGNWYTFIAANSYDENSRLFDHFEARAGQKLVQPPRISRNGGYRHMSFVDDGYVWGLSTSVQTEDDARNGSIHDRVKLVFNDRSIRGGESLTIDHFAPVGYRLLWTIVVEDHRDE